jgi:hypothetical protein
VLGHIVTAMPPINAIPAVVTARTASHLSGNRPSPTRFRVGHTKLRHLKDAVMPRGDNGIAHREGQRGE